MIAIVTKIIICSAVLYILLTLTGFWLGTLYSDYFSCRQFSLALNCVHCNEVNK
ncbi:hypothetical protein LJPFL01_2777 [Lelliottia jeotgali]|nr:hypothetical protein LJPFL01_2777 [Lelliottia jeotgali]